MDSNEVRKKFLKFFEERGHKIVPSSSLVPENDPSVLFTTAGMQQFKQYFTGEKDAEKDFGAKNVVTIQKCIRTSDIDEVGDSTHNTFLEMLGNFSFGGYGREEAISYAHEFITKELKLKISYVTIYKGEGEVPKDIESKKIWTKLNPNLEIHESGNDVFWGPTGENGPCGPTTEIYCKNGDGENVELWNIVFNEYFCDGSRENLEKGKAKLTKLKILGVDTGMGLERLLSTIQNKKDNFETDLFADAVKFVKEKSGNYRVHGSRVLVDHLRSAIFIIADGIKPSNTGEGYILRRLLRRVFTKTSTLELPSDSVFEIIKIFSNIYAKIYPEIKNKLDNIVSVVREEEKIFNKPLLNVEIYRSDLGVAKLGAVKKIRDIPIINAKNKASGLYIYTLFETFGVPIDLSIGVAKELGYEVDEKEIKNAIKVHQELSRTASAGMFKGGLANTNEKTVKLHTAHHLLLAALQAVVNPSIKQRGSNINEERLRLDFSFDRKLTDEEKKKVEDWVNDKIRRSLSVIRRQLPRHLAEKIGAQMEFKATYPEMVSVYFIGPSEDHPYEAISKEFCGGPHVANTSSLGHFKILKEEAISAGVRRIKGTLI